MKPIHILRNQRLTSETFDSRVKTNRLPGRHGHRSSGNRGFGQTPWEPSRLPPGSWARCPRVLALCDAGDALPPCCGVWGEVALRSRWCEFASYVVGIGVLITGFWWLAGLGLTPVQITLGLLLIGALSLAVVVLGMMTTVVRSLKR